MDACANMDAMRANMVRRCRETLTRLDAEAQKVSAEHGRASDAFLAAPLGSKDRAAREREVDECRYRDGCAHHAFEAARQLADDLGLIGVGEREFYKEPK